MATLKDREWEVKATRVRNILIREPDRWHVVSDIRRAIPITWVFDGNFKTYMKQLVEEGLVEKNVIDKKDVYRATKKLVSNEPDQQRNSL